MALGTSLLGRLLIIPELRVLVLTKRHVGSGNEIALVNACYRIVKIPCAPSRFLKETLRLLVLLSKELFHWQIS